MDLSTVIGMTVRLVLVVGAWWRRRRDGFIDFDSVLIVFGGRPGADDFKSADRLKELLQDNENGLYRRFPRPVSQVQTIVSLPRRQGGRFWPLRRMPRSLDNDF